tara:strand:+ start:644 stop:982 length:339 start_codon:yes stop_codon:yes gene_type:complete
MASAYINIATVVAATGDVTVYTVPAATQSILKNLQLYNSHTGSIVIYPKITDTSASATVTLQKITLATLASTAESADTSLTGPFVLETGDTLVLNCAVASKIHVFASILELS